LAVSDVVSYFSWPSGLAATFNACPPAVPPAAGVGDVGVEVEELVLLDELPHPARASRPTATVNTKALGMKRIFA
jgi:hypothetical protein